MIWKNKPTLEYLNTIGQNTLSEHLGIEMIEIGDDYLKAKMPVDYRTVQPFRILHGGASVAFAETLGSVASVLCVDVSIYQVVGVEINANHLSSAPEGSMVFGIVRPIRVGRTIHVWDIDITNEKGKKMCVSRITIAVVKR
jgi:1,4-dihydroxy-2-naphthoyl-CoA hydrolase